MKKILGLALVGALSVAALPAVAADYPMKAPPPPPAPIWTWTGFYVGGHVGAGWGTVESEIPIGPIVFPWSSHNINGFLGGLQLGYNYQAGWAVFGIEGDFSFADINGTTPCGIFNVFTCTTKIDWLADVAGRFGFVADRALIYIKGGVAWAHSKYTVSFLPPVGPSTNATDSRVGGLLGFGVEYAFAPNWSAKIEYNFIDFGKENVGFPVGGGTVNANIDQVLHVVKGGVNFHF